MTNDDQYQCARQVSHGFHPTLKFDSLNVQYDYLKMLSQEEILPSTHNPKKGFKKVQDT